MDNLHFSDNNKQLRNVQLVFVSNRVHLLGTH
jgi:hypothetical protein